jgi:hypothetical protein
MALQKLQKGLFTVNAVTGVGTFQEKNRKFRHRNRQEWDRNIPGYGIEPGSWRSG